MSASYPLLSFFQQNFPDDVKEFSLIDVGASGGIASDWFRFGDRLKAVGFDPLISEVKKLNHENPHPGVHYEEGFVVYHKLEDVFPKTLREDPILSKNNASWDRTSACEIAKIKHYDYIQHHFNSGHEVVYSERFFELDDYVQKHSIPSVDFIKVDTDGHDFPVLLSAEKTLDQSGVLGLSVECQFHGACHPYANTFSNIDSFLRSKGFSLFSLDVWKYTRSALPGPFVYDIFAQTQKGPVQWGEALYLRDLADPNYTQKFDFLITWEKVMKLACLYEMFGLQDCAAELLLEMSKKFPLSPHLDSMLNLLTPRLKGKTIRYRDYKNYCYQHPEKLLNISLRQKLEKFSFIRTLLTHPKIRKVAKKVWNLFR